ncbi:hypothetical protein ACHAWF_014161 [Thalassiosira exigua]
MGPQSKKNKTISVTVNGKEFLKIFGDADEAGDFFNSLQQVPGEARDVRRESSSFSVSSTYEQGLGKRFKNLERGLASHDMDEAIEAADRALYEDNLGVAFQNLRESIARRNASARSRDGSCYEEEEDFPILTAGASYEEGLGKRFQDLQNSLSLGSADRSVSTLGVGSGVASAASAAPDEASSTAGASYEEGLGKRFQDLQNSLSLGSADRSVSTLGVGSGVASAASAAPDEASSEASGSSKKSEGSSKKSEAKKKVGTLLKSKVEAIVNKASGHSQDDKDVGDKAPDAEVTEGEKPELKKDILDEEATTPADKGTGYKVEEIFDLITRGSSLKEGKENAAVSKEAGEFDRSATSTEDVSIKTSSTGGSNRKKAALKKMGSSLKSKMEAITNKSAKRKTDVESADDLTKSDGKETSSQTTPAPIVTTSALAEKKVVNLKDLDVGAALASSNSEMDGNVSREISILKSSGYGTSASSSKKMKAIEKMSSSSRAKLDAVAKKATTSQPKEEVVAGKAAAKEGKNATKGKGGKIASGEVSTPSDETLAGGKIEKDANAEPSIETISRSKKGVVIGFYEGPGDDAISKTGGSPPKDERDPRDDAEEDALSAILRMGDSVKKSVSEKVKAVVGGAVNCADSAQVESFDALDESELLPVPAKTKRNASEKRKVGLSSALGNAVNCAESTQVESFGEKEALKQSKRGTKDIDEDDMTELSIEVVKLKGRTSIGYFHPRTKPTQEKRGDTKPSESNAFDLSLMIDGAAVQSLTLGTQAMERLMQRIHDATNCNSEALEDEGQEQDDFFPCRDKAATKNQQRSSSFPLKVAKSFRRNKYNRSIQSIKSAPGMSTQQNKSTKQVQQVTNTTNEKSTNGKDIDLSKHPKSAVDVQDTADIVSTRSTSSNKSSTSTVKSNKSKRSVGSPKIPPTALHVTAPEGDDVTDGPSSNTMNLVGRSPSMDSKASGTSQKSWFDPEGIKKQMSDLLGAKQDTQPETSKEKQVATSDSSVKSNGSKKKASEPYAPSMSASVKEEKGPDSLSLRSGRSNTSEFKKSDKERVPFPNVNGGAVTGEADGLNERSESSLTGFSDLTETSQQSWFDPKILKKQMSSFLSQNTAAVDDERDCAKEATHGDEGQREPCEQGNVPEETEASRRKNRWEVDITEADIAHAKDWMSSYDRGTGKYYYYHKVTKETRWEKPLGFDEANTYNNAMRAQGLFNDNGKLWKAAVDSKTRKTYYYNIKTKEVSWMKPSREVML